MAERPSTGDYLKVLRKTVPHMAEQITELAKAEIKPAVKHGGIGAGMFGAAGVVGVTVLKLFMLTGAFMFSMIYHELAGRNPLTALTLGFLTMAVLGLLIAAVFALLGVLRVRRVKKPEATIAEAKASFSAVADAIELGVADAAEKRYPADARQVVDASKLPDRPSAWTHPELNN